MALLIGLYDASESHPEREAHWDALSAGRGVPIASARQGPWRAAIFAQYAGERVTAPDEGEGTHPLTIGFGGSAGTPIARAVPPALSCRYEPGPRSVTVTPDRLGFALVYRRQLGPLTAISNSALALRGFGSPVSRDPSAIAEFLTFEHLLGVRTYARELTLLPAGATLILSPEGVSTRTTFRLSEVARDHAKPSLEDTARELLPLFRAAVAGAVAKAQPGQRIELPLSGGLDSRLIAAALHEQGVSAQSFTFGARTSSGVPRTDVQIAERVAGTLNFPWRALELPADWLARHAEQAARLTDGQLDLGHGMCIQAVESVTPGGLLLDGIVGGVLMRGIFARPRMLRASSESARVDVLWRARARLERPAWQALLTLDARAELRERALSSLRESIAQAGLAEGRPDPRWFDTWVLTHRTRRFIGNGPLLWQAVATPAFPYAEPSFFERVFAVDPRVRLGGRLQAALYHAGYPHLAAIPLQKTGRPLARPGALGRVRQLFTRKSVVARQPFFDAEEAYAHSPRLRGWLRERLLDPTRGVARFGCFDTSEVERLLARMEQGREAGMARVALLASLVEAESAWSAA